MAATSIMLVLLVIPGRDPRYEWIQWPPTMQSGYIIPRSGILAEARVDLRGSGVEESQAALL